MPKKEETIVRGITFHCFSKFIDQMWIVLGNIFHKKEKLRGNMFCIGSA